ncbi:MAG: hypothetical protein CMB80_31085 [Flammeovirgaceae bacterium]|nr:hypothetical protein [Flammeovirgaceae bacterium]
MRDPNIPYGAICNPLDFNPCPYLEGSIGEARSCNRYNAKLSVTSVQSIIKCDMCIANTEPRNDKWQKEVTDAVNFLGSRQLTMVFNRLRQTMGEIEIKNGEYIFLYERSYWIHIDSSVFRCHIGNNEFSSCDLMDMELELFNFAYGHEWNRADMEDAKPVLFKRLRD